MPELTARAVARKARAGLRRVVRRSAGPAAASPRAEPPDPFWRLVSDDSQWPLPFAAYEEMHAVGPIFRSQNNHVIAVGFDAASAMLKHPLAHTFTAVDEPDLLGMGTASIIRKNPPRHGEIRKLLGTGGFSARNIATLNDVIRDQCEQLLDDAVPRGEFDAVKDYGLPLAVRVIGSILGIPPSYDERLTELGEAVSRLIDPWLTPEQWRTTRIASVEILDYFREMAAERRRTPGNDLIGVMVGAAGHEIDLTEDELLANSQFILLAGYETTVGMIGSTVDMLVDRPDVWARLQTDRELVPNVIEESLRLESPVQMVQRIAADDFEVLGHPVPKGWRIINVVAAANRDPSVFPNPAEFVPDRPNANRQLAFIIGAHHCLGSALARLEGQVAINTLLDRMPEIKRAGPATRRPNLVVRALKHVPIEFAS